MGDARRSHSATAVIQAAPRLDSGGTAALAQAAPRPWLRRRRSLGSGDTAALTQAVRRATATVANRATPDPTPAISPTVAAEAPAA
ncbi:hypothetical protein Apa02nite_088600 [Actinoplanes palleronii]|uniref:Uncharacterized protein n=1 Tax=Actinoplanes palleronii TaxID=113570 RepID=A0ABQ4BQ12_9ACTN|nr:hypothetical protein Apa02nite_088600 [Actinoplanes palleronii]